MLFYLLLTTTLLHHHRQHPPRYTDGVTAASRIATQLLLEPRPAPRQPEFRDTALVYHFPIHSVAFSDIIHHK